MAPLPLERTKSLQRTTELDGNEALFYSKNNRNQFNSPCTTMSASLTRIARFKTPPPNELLAVLDEAVDVLDIVDATDLRLSSRCQASSSADSGDSVNVRHRRICSGPTGIPFTLVAVAVFGADVALDAGTGDRSLLVAPDR